MRIGDATKVSSARTTTNNSQTKDGKYMKGQRLVIVKGGRSYDAAGHLLD